MDTVRRSADSLLEIINWQADEAIGSDLKATACSPRRQLTGYVLLAEDNPVNRQVAVGMLEALGCRVDTVSNGREAVQAVTRTRYDLVFMDCQMPEMDGIEAVRQIQAWQRTAGSGESERKVPPIVALTGHVLEEDRETCLAAGMDEHLSKPFTLDQLYAVLSRRLPLQPEQEARPPAPPASQRLSASHAAESLDPKTLTNLRALESEGRPGLVSQLMRVYLMTAARQLVELRQAVAQRDAAGVSRIAHSLKSSSLNVGAVRCAEHCRTLERMGHTETHESFEAIFRGLEADFAAVQHAIEEELRRTRDGGGHGG